MKKIEPEPLIVGCWQLGGEYWGQIDVPEIQSAIQLAWDKGLRSFDTAPLYGNGLADQRLVEALGERRHEAQIYTKVGARIIGEHAQSDLSASFIREDVEQSLRRLKLDCLDVVQVHWPCEQGTTLDESFSMLAKLKEEGKINQIGVCNYEAEELEEILKILPLYSLQTPYSLIRREFEQQLEEVVLRNSMQVLAYEGLCRGLLSGKYKTPPQFSDDDMRSWDQRFEGKWFWHTRSLLDSLEKLSQKTGYPLVALALGWILQRESISSVIVGIKNRQQLESNLRALELRSKPKVLEIMNKILSVHGSF